MPSNFRNFTALTQLIPGMTPNPAASTFEGGQVVANGTPSQQNVYLIDGMYNNDDRLGGSQGTQVRVVLDNIEEYQVLSNQYSAEYGGGAGAIINMVTRGGTNNFNGRAYTYFRDDKFNARGHFLPPTAQKPTSGRCSPASASAARSSGIARTSTSPIEKDNEDIAGQKRFPAAAAPLAKDMIGAFEVRAMNYFGRGDLQLNEKNFLNVRWVLETAPTRGEGFNTNDQTIDAQTWESDWDHLISGSYTTVVGDRGSNVIRVGRIGEELATGAQAFFDDDVNFIGFAGRDPFSIGQSNDHPSYVTGKGGQMVRHAHPHLCRSTTRSATSCPACGAASTPSRWAAASATTRCRRGRRSTPASSSSGATRRTTRPIRRPIPFQFDVIVGPPSVDGYDVFSQGSPLLLLRRGQVPGQQQR